ncbi:hypothetical protein DPSP01_009341 [Paraphaeosphaeria sporulosa]|uniref:Alkyl hydroperoxide reductase subunit C/ Thiol specific antioxidant domain-containing protein n=1 Tax=Paraphaeosphaeria sporulosa TaxID=1460663 RepID=A0A177CJQ8_9PLEO|nr:uncharacterized protein CC84DRAFT_708401 [Paraphaeosphaeria sporulosa]OAG07733.1 hypothetical protein CC84DRAFT_708401 [Paraphaeosphaeria sporulosa]
MSYGPARLSGRWCMRAFFSLRLPSVALSTTSGDQVDLPSLSGLKFRFCYPRTGAPDEKITPTWNAVPGARVCTPQVCSFRDKIDKFRQLRVEHLYGLSTQDTQYQQEARERLHLPYDLLSDDTLEFAMALKLPTFEW